MNINKSTRFALYAIVELAKSAPNKLSVIEISRKYNISEHHMSKVMQLLTRYQIVEAVRGVGGGYQLLKSPNSLSVMDIINIVEPQFISDACQLKSQNETCPKEAACVIHDLFNEVSRQVAATFSAVTIATLAAKDTNLLN